MIAPLLRDALAGVAAADRQKDLDLAVRRWSGQLGRLATATQRDPYLRKAPEILAAGANLAEALAHSPGYQDVALTVCGALAGLRGSPPPKAEAVASGD